MEDVVLNQRREGREGIINYLTPVVFAIHVFAFVKNMTHDLFF